jgi:prepilin-type processing-associated H-X9-DG protein
MKTTAFILTAAFLSSLCAEPARSGQDLPPLTRRDVQASQNNLKQIGLAFHNYHDAYNKLPTDIKDKDGTPILSWRVAILPFLDQDAGYRAFKLDEPWDSEHNKKLIAKTPKMYAPVRAKAKEGETFYQTFTGEQAVFGRKGKPLTLISITDGTSNTGMVFEAGEPVVWTKPADMLFDEKKPLPKLGGLFDGECNVVMCDGSVKRLKKGADEKELRKLIMPADGNPIDFAKLEK